MRLTTSGRALGLTSPIVGQITIAGCSEAEGEREPKVLVGSLDGPLENFAGYRAVVSVEGSEQADLVHRSVGTPVIHSVRHTDHFREGDVVSINPADGFIRTVYRPDSGHNTLFITERCNSNCLMCSQPPKDVDDTDFLLKVNLETIRYMSPSTTYLTITGGEPTLLGERLLTLLSELKSSLPGTRLHMLTNGRIFAWGNFAKSLATVNHPNLSLGIPLYSDYARDHDHIVQAKDAFDQTILGLHQLARWRIPTEIRIVLHKLSIPRLPNLAEYIARNLPFASHVALMGLEPTGYTPRNRDQLWIDPTLYQDQLERAVETLVYGGLNVSIYNTQLCLLRQGLWQYARRSISDWKNVYLDECTRCVEVERCGGLFKSGERMHSANIRAIVPHLLQRDSSVRA